MSVNKHINVNDGSNRKFEDNTVGEVVLDTTPQLGSFNGVTSDGVARAISGASGEVPVINPGDNGKVLTAVDGAAAWAEAQGGSSYTAGDGIAIENDEIKVRVKDGNPLKVTSPEPVGSDVDLSTPEGSPEEEGWKAMSNGLIHYEYNDKHDETDFVFRYLWNRNDPNPLGMVSGGGDDTLHFDAKIHLLFISGKESYTDIIATSGTLSDAFTVGRYAWDKSGDVAVYSLGTLVDTTEDGYVFEVRFTVPGEYIGDANYIAVSSSGSDYSGINETVASVFLNESHVLTLPGDSVYVIGETIPGGDLYVDVDQDYDRWSSNPQSGIAVSQAVSRVRQVPYASESDRGKVLTVDNTGAAAWATPTAPSGGARLTAAEESALNVYPDGSSAVVSITSRSTNRLKIYGTDYGYYNEAFTPEESSTLMVVSEPIVYKGYHGNFSLSFGYSSYSSVIPSGYKAAWCPDLSKSRYYIVESGATLPSNSSITDVTIKYISKNTSVTYDHSGDCDIPYPPSVRPDYMPDPTKYTKVGDWSSVTSDVHRWYLGFVNPSTGTWMTLPTEYVSGTAYVRAGAQNRYGLEVPSEVPAYTSADAGKVLQVQNDGTLAWVTLP